MMVMGENVIQTVRVAWCGCDHSDTADPVSELLQNGWYPVTVALPHTVVTFDTLDTFRVLNVTGNMNVWDYVTSMEIISDGMRAGEVTDRYKTFGRMQRQYAFLLHMKRSGRAHDIGGIAGTPPGGAAVLCWACPHEHIHMPEGWRDVDPSYQFIYMLFIAMDANFQMKNRLRANT
ncbi:hypothetical protein C8J56DRAFT_792613 [Mycena floridula]|nr:hypothetical protein C8J56DRAFT_792613 [Mycena floridula]